MTRDGWQAFVDGLRTAGDALAESTAHLDAQDRAHGQRALVRAVNNLLGRLEVDRDRPELAPFNGWREKFFMDNPDFRYWITDIRHDRTYRITGNVGDSVYQSITVYSGSGVADAAAVARLDSDDLEVGAAGDFTATLSDLPAGSSSVWVRYAYESAAPDDPGWCRIDVLDAVDDEPPVATDLDRALRRLGTVIANVPKVFEVSTTADAQSPNTVRHWSAMAAGAAFTEPGIHYLRGSWQLADGEALVLEGTPPTCRHWNIVLYNRFLNSLDHRHRTVTRTAASSALVDGRFRFVLAAEDPGVAGCDWLDTEGLGFGLFVLRFLHADAAPELPVARRVRLEELR
ncbi:DUF1214 domain-containing protein [Mycolicibacterium confluentis]|uniref:DUF1214 domain-containing protein n=1 Tax=Mycolicibacterium confluentis TaxID=28047 RepID=A0A7I7XT46_9MYCO|nr:DUF1214 domain-containing protein [Mycolicibacterium confluentis]MCV7321137.1 DUF1214 domain-containing protein [Mycolicibacterium confluentis]ORV21266.1 hypothetical protein AWB99_27065 [Mycolicibacterium confluentis]BBZ32387.1 hypothetical protein MCNF_09920 [Mycolicibacterium confluentis]